MQNTIDKMVFLFDEIKAKDESDVNDADSKTV